MSRLQARKLRRKAAEKSLEEKFNDFTKVLPWCLAVQLLEKALNGACSLKCD